VGAQLETPSEEPKISIIFSCSLMKDAFKVEKKTYMRVSVQLIMTTLLEIT